MQITINDTVIEAREGDTILTAARRNGIAIMTLCDHKALSPWGACRLCLVEITFPSWDGWSKVVTACSYPVKEGLIATTKSEQVKKARTISLDLLLARAPNAPRIQQLAKTHGLTKSTFPADEGKDDCILCNICVRVCDKLGANAISTVSRGSTKGIGTPFNEGPPDCIGCASCARSCPTETIKVTEEENKRTIWGRTFTLVTCEECGAITPYTEEQVAFLEKSTTIPKEYYTTCDACSRKRTALSFGQVVVDPSARHFEEWHIDFDKVTVQEGALGNASVQQNQMMLKAMIEEKSK
jgi:bidirectional [NiFe] hydrogenase diaphorase subunit